MPLRSLIIVLLAAAALSGCGRRGSLEAPGTPPQAAGAYGAPANDVSPLDPGSNPDIPARQEQIQPPPRRRYFLDFLL